MTGRTRKNPAVFFGLCAVLLAFCLSFAGCRKDSAEETAGTGQVQAQETEEGTSEPGAGGHFDPGQTDQGQTEPAQTAGGQSDSGQSDSQKNDPGQSDSGPETGTGTPLGYLKLEEYYFLLDEDGIILGAQPEPAEDLPEISGLPVTSAVTGNRLQTEDDAELETVLTLLRLLFARRNAGASDPVQSIELDGDGRLTLVSGQIRAFFGSAEYLPEKLDELFSILPSLKGREGTLFLNTYSENNREKGYVFRP